MSESGSEPGGVKLAELPELHLADWRATKDTLHLYSQIIGKIRLATTAPRNHWWNVPLYVDVRGLTTRRLHHHDTTFQIALDVEIKEEPFGVPMTTPFPQDLDHASWDRDAIARVGRILDWSDSVLEEFSGWFNGKTSPVHLFWHSLDLAVSRFSGRPGVPIDADRVTQEAYSQEVISFGFWAGDDNV